MQAKLQQIMQPGCPRPFFPGHVQLVPQAVDKLQNTAGVGFNHRLHYQLATAIQDRDDDRSLVHVHADILNVATHSVASLGERASAFNCLSLKVKCHSLSDSPISRRHTKRQLAIEDQHHQKDISQELCQIKTSTELQIFTLLANVYIRSNLQP